MGWTAATKEAGATMKVAKERQVVPPSSTDDWFTPVDFFAGLHARVRFTVDVASHPQAPISAWLPRSYLMEDDGLAQSWAGERVWCNPPYSSIEPWVSKADAEMRAGCEFIAMLLPATKTEQPFWGRFIECRRDGRGWGLDPFELRTTFLPRRRRFGFPGDPSGATGHGPRFGLVLLEWERRRLRRGGRGKGGAQCDPGIRVGSA